MNKDIQVKLLGKKMTRREFLQFAGSSILILFGLSNIIAFINHTQKAGEATAVETAKASNGFGSRRFGA